VVRIVRCKSGIQLRKARRQFRRGDDCLWRSAGRNDPRPGSLRGRVPSSEPGTLRAGGYWWWRILNVKDGAASLVPERLCRKSGGSMSRGNPDSDDDMRPEYDFSAGVRGKHHEQYKAGANVVFLDTDIDK